MWSTRSLRALAVAALLSIPIAAPASATDAAPADTFRGVTAPVITLDQLDMAGVACVFVTKGNFPVVTEIRATPPQILWPDRRPGDPDEHGRVTWRVIVQAGAGEISATWSRLAASRVRSGIAHESTGATLASVRVPIPKGTKRWLRVVHVVTWRARDGHVLGSLRRVQHWTSWIMDGQEGYIADVPCPSILSKALPLAPTGP